MHSLVYNLVEFVHLYGLGQITVHARDQELVPVIPVSVGLVLDDGVSWLLILTPSVRMRIIASTKFITASGCP